MRPVELKPKTFLLLVLVWRRNCRSAEAPSKLSRKVTGLSGSIWGHDKLCDFGRQWKSAGWVVQRCGWVWENGESVRWTRMTISCPLLIRGSGHAKAGAIPENSRARKPVRRGAGAAVPCPYRELPSPAALCKCELLRLIRRRRQRKIAVVCSGRGGRGWRWRCDSKD
jgi:hypothetical protein